MAGLQMLALLLISLAANAARGAFSEINTVEALSDKISDPLPGFSSSANLPFEHYAGYITVNESAGRALFYWLVEAAEDPSSKPLVLWLNGGPGCSSVGYGAMQELGPFHLDNTRVVLNPYSWNKVANILFLDSPAGVGFSYSNTTSDLTTGEERTTIDSYIFLQNWLERFPKYKNREFYLTGESYAGFYVPLLTKFIYDKNKEQQSSDPVINLKGFMVGNAVVDNRIDLQGMFDYWFSHALISHYTLESLIRHCLNGNDSTESVNECDRLVDYAFDHEFGLIDPYSIYSETCLVRRSTRRAITRGAPHKLMWRIARRLSRYDPCIEDEVTVYLNKPEVQKVLHANVTESIPYPWACCSETVGANWNTQVTSVLPIYRELIQAGLRIWIYSGDVDAVVPVTSTKYAIQNLNLRIVTPWFPWYRNQQVGGHSEVYEGLTFVTIRGAGHEVPMFQPARAFSLIQAFIAGREMPKQALNDVDISAL